ncbi:recombinase RecT [Capnocytophaga canimorsus]|uniref:recombinase RecT n=1 Tax=Capnocytophaga canimorsus TaxID=28188 RepID=UPI0037D667E5
MNTTNQNQQNTTKQEVALTINQKNITDNVLQRVNSLREHGALKIPKDYSPENALKSAFLILSETKDKNGNNALEVCTPNSIANSLLSMVVQGLSPMKKQCYFIPYNGQLQLNRSYQGSIAMAKRVGLKDVVMNVIYEKDEFVYKINPETGRTEIVKHEQKLENIDISKIRGAYALTTMEDGTKQVTVMNIEQIRKAWLQGHGRGNTGAHNNFTDEMCKKTVINRACKQIINSSDDSYLDNEDETEQMQSTPQEKTMQTLSIEETPYEEVKTLPAENKELKIEDVPQPEPVSAQPTETANGQMKAPF